jgi:hypothetical protein
MHVLEFFRLKIFYQNLFLRLDLEQLQQKAYEVRRTLVAVHSANGLNLNGLINETFG